MNATSTAHQRALFAAAEGHKIAGSSKLAKPIEGTAGAVLNLKPGDIQIDPSYQRPLNANHARDIALHWDWRAYQPISVAMRPDGSLWCYDGQHRLVAAQMRADLATLPCWVVQMAGPTEEARWWIDLNANRKRIKPIEDYKARSVAKDVKHQWLNDFFTVRGITAVGKKTGLLPYECNAVSHCLDRLKAADQDAQKVMLHLAFDVLERAWPGQPKTYSGRAVLGMTRAISMLGMDSRALLKDQAKERLGRFTVEAVLEEVRVLEKARGKPAPADLPRVILDKFNFGAKKHVLTV